jgi:hypothetical protein
MLRKACLAALLAALAATGYGATINPDVYDLRLDVQSSLESDAYEFPPLSGSIGYFPIENFEVGGLIGLRNSQWDSYWVTGNVLELGVFAENHLEVDFKVHPLFGLRLSLLDGEENSDTAYQAYLYAGGKVFLTPKTALVLNGGVAFATEDIYNVKTTRQPDLSTTQTGDSVGAIVDLGLRYFF